MEILFFIIPTIIFASLLWFLYCRQIASIKIREQELAEDEQELVKAEEDSITNFVEKVNEIDKELLAHINNIQLMNTVAFECPCNHNIVSTFIDLSKEENTFICPECKNEYRVEISMIPIIKGKIVDDRNMYNLLSEKFGSINAFKETDNRKI